METHVSGQINTALIGYGYWGPNIARTMGKIPGVTLHTICDLSDKSLQRARTSHPLAQTTKQIDRIACDSNITTVIISSPASTHFRVASRMIEAGKHILIEKPLTTSVSDADNLISLQKKHQTVAMVGHTFEYNPSVRKIKHIIHKPTFGTVFYMYSTRVNLGQIRGDVNALWNLAPHDISTMNYLLDARPTAVMACGGSFLRKDIEDVAFIMVRYPNNILGQIHISWLDPLKERKMTIVGSKKMLTFDDLDNVIPIRVYDKRADTGEVARGLDTEYKIKLYSGSIHIPRVTFQEPLTEELKHFFHCVRTGQRPLTDLSNGRSVVHVLAACQESLHHKNTWIPIR